MPLLVSPTARPRGNEGTTTAHLLSFGPLWPGELRRKGQWVVMTLTEQAAGDY